MVLVAVGDGNRLITAHVFVFSLLFLSNLASCLNCEQLYFGTLLGSWRFDDGDHEQ